MTVRFRQSGFTAGLGRGHRSVATIRSEGQMSEKDTMLRQAEEAFAELRQTVDRLTDEEVRRVWLGSWGIREILIHISGWHQAMIAGFANLAKGEAPYPPGTYDDFDAWNARFVEAKTGVKPADVLAELDVTHRRFVGTAAALPEALFAPGGGARDSFDGAGAGHYREHAAQIREWRQRGS